MGTRLVVVDRAGRLLFSGLSAAREAAPMTASEAPRVARSPHVEREHVSKSEVARRSPTTSGVYPAPRRGTGAIDDEHPSDADEEEVAA